jgi:glycosyltransferase involved in cell wall biosynthesis
LYWLKAGVSRIYEVQLTRRSRLAFVASAEEVPLLKPARRVYCLPNGFDFPDSPPTHLRDSKKFIFFGSLYYKPNADGIRWLCQQIWPTIIRHIPDAYLDIVGHGHKALGIDPPRGVTFHGFVDDLDALIKQAAALVVPLRIGGGTRIKILEAWAKGLPVISTRIGAEGLANQDSETLLLADTAEEFAEQCRKCLEDSRMSLALAQTAYTYGQSHYDWKAISARVQDLITFGSQ